MLRHVSSAVLMGVFVSMLGGCGDAPVGGKRVPVYKVTGKITMQGGALAGANVTFGPKEGQPVAVGVTNDAGEFTLTTYDAGDGAAAGEYSVVVMKVKPAAASPADAGHGQAVTAGGHSGAAAQSTANLVPEQYGDSSKTPLAAKVEAKSDNNFTFEIK